MGDIRPRSRDEFRDAILCALPPEAEAVLDLFDCFWDDDGDVYGKATNDPNDYRTGRIGQDNVVLCITGVGKAKAATAISSLKWSYTQVQRAFVVGICGGVPRPKPHDTGAEILLGDVIISSAVVQSDFGSRWGGDCFEIKTSNQDRLGKADASVSAQLRSLGIPQNKDRLEERAARFLSELQERRPRRYDYPGTALDRLYPSTYRHRHRRMGPCKCTDRQPCATAAAATCHTVGCEESEITTSRPRLAQKRRLEGEGETLEAQAPVVHIGSIASGDTVMKSAEVRDQIARDLDVIGFEMEAVGVWDQQNVACVVVKGVCDYADCHKNDIWQRFASAAAASVMKGMLKYRVRADETPPLSIIDEHRASRQLQNMVYQNEIAVAMARLEGENRMLHHTVAMLQDNISAMIHAQPGLQSRLVPQLSDQSVRVVDARAECMIVHLGTITSKEVGLLIKFRPEREELTMDTGIHVYSERPISGHRLRQDREARVVSRRPGYRTCRRLFEAMELDHEARESVEHEHGVQTTQLTARSAMPFVPVHKPRTHD
ncbi:nucleoside phosphorylase domain-containing protein [Lasiosphaeria miniovina]|uniref:Nucleoside phosphorylase domain-containing protein n=1 Tax=Lasiosphaeria miniovina TaxID=1954250 RepID=A0AA40AB74_9PEZI|nr:nucleoside phosphorylase domain-containing protein [Lasiosphaeria miniovina]KAK0712637.1 nucleoside phosphorylase domain-containing protein [Lasiosphaeria miniovina]